MPTSAIQVKRIYDEPASTDGCRALVDRLWPRGMRKEDAALDLWAKEAAPSAALRRECSHDPEQWPTFRRRYLAELRSDPDRTTRLRDALDAGRTLTLLYASRDVERNHAIVLREFLLKP